MVVLAVALYLGFTFYSGSDEVIAALFALPVSIWGLILLFSLINYGLRYWRWHLYIQKSEKVSITHIKHLAIYIAGFSLTMTPGKAGEAMRSLYLKQQGVSHQTTLAALFVERIMDLLAVLILAAFGLSLLDGQQAAIATIVTILLIIGCVVAVKLPWALVLEWKWVKALPEKLLKICHFIASMLANANKLISIPYFLIGLLIGVVAWGFEGYGLHLVMMEYAIQPIEINVSVAVYSIAVLLGAIAFLPGGLGGTEAAMVFMLIKLGFSPAEATAITFICRIATLWFAIVLGIIVMFIMSCLGLKPVLQED